MRMDVVTLFPEMVEQAVRFGVVGRALTKNLWSLALWNPRAFTSDPHRTVDDRPYGGGPGMVMLAAPLAAALKAARVAQADAGCAASRVLYLSPAGTPLTHARVTALNAQAQQGIGLILLAGRYEGIDERLLAREVDEEIAVGDFVVSGGELPALMLIDALVRQLPGALNDEASAEEESFVDGLLDCPHYTRPPVYEDEAVPEVLLSGDHAAIAQWRRIQSLGRTAERRPELLERRGLTKEDARLLEKYWQAHTGQAYTDKAKK
ncbi:MAG: tRNA (guanosine(37)-N1)-methyltransferase TrmD [Betaproteobacteria bacterium]|nr:tRNA (guanosine(37)-N1)-methyltransferase TrmD [Betaproteobacteria bacterium]